MLPLMRSRSSSAVTCKTPVRSALTGLVMSMMTLPFSASPYSLTTAAALAYGTAMITMSPTGAVPAFPITDELGVYPSVGTLRYPKAGFPNSRVKLGVLAIASPQQVRWLDVGADTGQYLARMEWADQDSLVIQRLPRKQNRLDVLMVSAATGGGLDRLLDALAAGMPPGPHLYPDDDLTDLPDRLLAAELVREQIFLQIQEEIPYGTTVETENWQEKPDGSVRVDATIYVARAGHKAILIGAGGGRIKEIGARARKELTVLLERPVHLFLNVKERAGWDEEGARLRAIGLDDTA